MQRESYRRKFILAYNSRETILSGPGPEQRMVFMQLKQDTERLQPQLQAGGREQVD